MSKSDKSTPPKAGGTPGKSDSTGEFFSVGSPLHAVRAGYVRRPADDVLFDSLQAGRFTHVLAPNNSGKSSLIAATAARLEAAGIKVATLDLQQIAERDGGSDAGRWYYSVAYRLLRQLRIRFDLQEWWQDKAILSNRQRLVEFYSEVILGNVSEWIVVFVDEVQCVGKLTFATDLLASVRAAHNARTTDPEFSRLTFALLGECDPDALIDQAEVSPFSVTQAVTLGDFTREQIELFGTELGLTGSDVETALDRIYYWTSGQPYLVQKLSRAIAREGANDDIAEQVDRLAIQQLSGRAALNNEPHMSHMHRTIVQSRHREALLNLYGKIRKGIDVAADLGSPEQRFLLAVGLLAIDDNRRLAIRNRLYGSVFTTRWANENMPIHWRVPVVATAAVLLMVLVPFWYTQILPRAYVDRLTVPGVSPELAVESYANYRSFPGHAAAADSLFRSFLLRRAEQAESEAEIERIAALAAELPQPGSMADEFVAAFWDRQARAALRDEQRDAALLASLRALQLTTPQRRRRAAALVSDDYPLLLASLAQSGGGEAVFDADNMTLTRAQGAMLSQWVLSGQTVQRNDDWRVTALEVTPLLRRVIVDRGGPVRRIGLTLGVNHPRLADLRIKLIAPSGRTAELRPEAESAGSEDRLVIPATALRDFVGEDMQGTWTLSVRDEAPGVDGHLMGWNLKLGSQVLVEDFPRPIAIPKPVERETDNIWFSDDGRYAIARTSQSDSARIWNLQYAKPIRALALGENEQLIGLDTGARRLLTATQDTVHLWDTASGDRVSTLQVGPTSSSSLLTADGQHLFVQRRGDIVTELELWSLESGKAVYTLSIAGTPAQVSVDASGSRVAVADYDRAVRVWDFRSGDLLAQLGLPEQPSDITLSAAGDTLGVVYGEQGVSLWRVEQPRQPLFERLQKANWNLLFSRSGARVLAGAPQLGYQVYLSEDGRVLGPQMDAGTMLAANVLGFSQDEQTLVIGSTDQQLRYWRVPEIAALQELEPTVAQQKIWSPSGDRVVAVSDDARTVAIGDRNGGVYLLPVQGGAELLAQANQQISFLGHKTAVQMLRMNAAGTLVASAAIDNTIRVWNVPEGDPRAYNVDIVGAAISDLRFSPDSSMLAVLNDNRVQLLDVLSGDSIAAFELGESHSAMAFADSDRLYLGGDSGAIQVVSRQAGGSWNIRSLWQGQSAVHWLEASPNGTYLVVVDGDNHVSQFDTSSGQPGGLTMQLPGPVSEVRFSLGGSRVLFRNGRWVHRAVSSRDGLSWLGSMHGPGVLPTARIVFGEEPELLGERFYLAGSNGRFLEMQEYAFAATAGASLFGSRNELLLEWQNKLSGR